MIFLWQFLLIFFVGLIILLFTSKKLSPIPYFPTNKKDLPIIIKALNLKNRQTIVDLGAGDGVVIFAAASNAYNKKLNTQFIAVEINPVLVLTMYLRRLFHPNKKNIKIVWFDLFKNDFMNFINFRNFITFYLYFSPWLLEKIITNLQSPTSNISFVSYMYPIKSLKRKETIFKGKKHNIFVYE